MMGPLCMGVNLAGFIGRGSQKKRGQNYIEKVWSMQKNGPKDIKKQVKKLVKSAKKFFEDYEQLRKPFITTEEICKEKPLNTGLK